MSRRRAKVDKSTWEDFLVNVNTEIGVVPFCGLCSNTGTLESKGKPAPNGVLVPSTTGFCICPNGRTGKYAHDKAKK